MSQQHQKPLQQKTLDRLHDTANTYLGTGARISLTAETVYRITDELRDLREELFRLRVCDSVDRFIDEEFHDDEIYDDDFFADCDRIARDLSDRMWGQEEISSDSSSGDSGRQSVPVVEEYFPYEPKST